MDYAFVAMWIVSTLGSPVIAATYCRSIAPPTPLPTAVKRFFVTPFAPPTSLPTAGKRFFVTLFALPTPSTDTLYFCRPAYLPVVRRRPPVDSARRPLTNRSLADWRAVLPVDCARRPLTNRSFVD